MFYVKFMSAIAGDELVPKLVWSTVVSCQWSFLIFFFLMTTAFMGYVLPFGQMSFWGATVIINLLSAFPSLVEWFCGGH